MLAIRGATLYTITGRVIIDGTLLIDKGRIAAVGHNIAIPEGAEVMDLPGCSIMPGIIEAHSHLGMGFSEDDEADGPAQGGGGALGPAATPELSVIDAFNPRSEDLRRALAAGVTATFITPGSGKVISGTGFVAKTWGRKHADMVMKNPAGMKMAFGENPKSNFGRRGMMPSTRMGVAYVLRDALTKAKQYKEAKARAQEAGRDMPVDLKMEALIPVLERRLVCRIHAHRADDMMTVLRIADEFGLDVVIEHASDGFKIPDEVVKRQVPCVVGPSLRARVKVETRDRNFRGPGIMEKAGIKVAITTDAPVVPAEYLRESAALACKEGMSEAGALAAITQIAAEIMGVAERIGSLEAGKDADLVVFDGHPLELTSKVLAVYVDGQKAYDRATHKEPWQSR